MRLDGTDDDEMADDPNTIAAEMEMETKCAAGQCKSIPDKNLMKIKVHFTQKRLCFLTTNYKLHLDF